MARRRKRRGKIGTKNLPAPAPHHVLAGEGFRATMGTIRKWEAELLGIVYGFEVLSPQPEIPFTTMLLRENERRQLALHTLVGGIFDVTTSMGGMVERLERKCLARRKGVA
jgi:hypothetical protein